MTLDLTFYLFTIPAVVFAGISKGGFANGPGFAAAAFLAIVLEPTQAVALMLPILMVMDVTALRTYWGKWDPITVKAMVLGALPGLFLGLILFGWINAELVRLSIGVIAIAFVVFQVAQMQGWLKLADRAPSRWSALFWGAMSGFTSFVSHAGGPPAAIYMLGLRLDKSTYQASTVAIFSVMNALKFLGYLSLGLFTKDTAVAVVTLIPAAIGGTLLGVWAHHLMSPKWFFRLAYLFLLGTGMKLTFDALA